MQHRNKLQVIVCLALGIGLFYYFYPSHKNMNLTQPSLHQAAIQCDSQRDNAFCQFLNSTQSTTAYFKAHCKGQYNVALHKETWRTLKPSERTQMQLANEDLIFVREAWMRCGNTNYMFARSLFPEATLNVNGGALKILGAKSLGEVLYQDTSLRREILTIQKLETNSDDYQLISSILPNKPAYLWQRVSLIYYHQQPLLLMEVFLPNMVQQLAQYPVEVYHD